LSSDKRRNPRQIVNLPAWINIGNDARLRKCTLVDLSGFGGRLVVEDIENVPDKFDLVLSRFGLPCHPCRVVWRNNNEMGVGFVARPLNDADRSIETANIGALLRELGGLRGFAAHALYRISAKLRRPTPSNTFAVGLMRKVLTAREWPVPPP